MDTEQVTAPLLKRSREERERELAEEAAADCARAVHTLTESFNTETRLKGELKRAVEEVDKLEKEVDKLEKELRLAKRRRQYITYGLDNLKATKEYKIDEYLKAFNLLCDRCEQGRGDLPTGEAGPPPGSRLRLEEQHGAS
jgi:chromosome segregation ATPase